MSGGSVLDYDFATGGAVDRINVSGLLTIGGGTLNLSDLGGLSLGTYTLINYGSLNGSIANLSLGATSSSFSYKLLDSGSAINLQVTLPGDFNADGRVDTADYVVWREGLGTNYTQIDYDLWRSNFGQVAGSGSALAGGATVPEPGAVVQLLLALAVGTRLRRRKQS